MPGLLDYFSTPEAQGLLGLSAGLLGAGGRQGTPINFGQALGQGFLQGGQMYQNARLLNEKTGLQNLQAQTLKENLDANKRTQAAIESMAATLPESERGLFLANPAAYIKSKTEGYTLSPGQERQQGGQVIGRAAPNLTPQDMGGGIGFFNPQTGVQQAGAAKTMTPDAVGNLGQRQYEFGNLSAQQQGQFARDDRAFNGLSANQRLLGNQRNTELGLSGLNTYYNTGMSMPGMGLPNTPPLAAPGFPQGQGGTGLTSAGGLPLSPKNAQEIAVAAGRETAVAQAKNSMDLPTAQAKADQAIALVDQMVGDAGRQVPKGQTPREPHPGFQDVVGSTWRPGMRFVPGSNAANFDALYEQVKGGAFLQAFETLKGGGQITEVEGAKATQAITRMQRAQSEEEFVKAAREFQDNARKGMQLAREKAGQASGGWSIRLAQ